MTTPTTSQTRNTPANQPEPRTQRKQPETAWIRPEMGVRSPPPAYTEPKTETPETRGQPRGQPAPRERPSKSSVLQLVPVTFSEAAGFVAMWHRHNVPPIGHKFSLGVADDDKLVGVAIVGRPVARHYDDGRTLEVNRTATDGTRNANSMLYAAAWKVTKNLGYRRLITYTQAAEPGTSLRAAGWRVIAARPPRTGWNTPSRPREDNGADGIPRTLWEAVA